MLEERGEEFTSTEEMMKQPAEKEEGPTVTEVSDRQVSIGEAPPIVPQEERQQEQEQEQEQQEPKISKRKQKRRIASYLSDISKQVEKNGNQINKITMMAQSIQQERQKQTKSKKGAGASQLSLQSIKQLQAQVSQLQKQLTRIQNNIQKIRTAPASQVRFRKQSPTAMKSKSKKSKSSKASKRKKQKAK